MKIKLDKLSICGIIIIWGITVLISFNTGKVMSKPIKQIEYTTVYRVVNTNDENIWNLGNVEEQNKFHNALNFVLEKEGGYRKSRFEPGGAVNFGISQKIYNYYRKLNNKPRQSVKEITDKEIIEIYYKLYWKKIDGDNLVEPFDVVMFDTAVLMGVPRAYSILNKTINGAKIDSEDLDNHNVLEFSQIYLHERQKRHDLVISMNPSLEKFRIGWYKRVTSLFRYVEIQTEKRGKGG